MGINSEDLRDEFKEAQAQGQAAERMAGGAPSASDQDAAGGSGGTGGYGNAQNQSLHQGQTGGPDANAEHPATRELSRGERFDLEQGGGRGADAVDFEQELAQDDGLDKGAVTEGQQP
jgi:hypothetical protein